MRTIKSCSAGFGQFRVLRRLRSGVRCSSISGSCSCDSVPHGISFLTLGNVLRMQLDECSFKIDALILGQFSEYKEEEEDMEGFDPSPSLQDGWAYIHEQFTLKKEEEG